MAVGERQPFLPIVLKPNIEAERPCPAPGLLDQLDRAIRPGKIEVGDPDKGAAGRKRQAGRPPDATAGSCHKRRLIRKFRHITSSSSGVGSRSEEHTSALQSIMRISYAVFFLKDQK